MEMGSIAKWTLTEGSKFEAGTAICEVETDKATVTYEATEEGFIAKILVGTGEVKVGQPLMITVDEQADVAAFASYVHTASTAVAAPAAAPVAPSAPVTTPAAAPVAAAPVAATSAAAAPSSGGRVFASPYARKLAREAGLPINAIPGSGPNGRVVGSDVMQAQKTGIKTPTTGGVSTSAPRVSTGGVPGVYQDFELSDLALAVASRQVWAKQNVPHYYLSVELNLSKVLQLREDLNKAAAGDADAARVSVLDFFVKASALAMKKVPDVNGAWNDTFVRRYSQVDINVVIDSPAGLITPVVRNVSPTGIRQIAKELDSIEALVGTGGEIDGSKIQLGTFSIHDLGKYGVKSAAPIVISPQSCALAIGAISDTVIPRTQPGEPAWQVAPMVTVTLSCDHRVVDGAVGAQWLAALKALIEDPVTMIL